MSGFKPAVFVLPLFICSLPVNSEGSSVVVVMFLGIWGGGRNAERANAERIFGRNADIVQLSPTPTQKKFGTKV